MQLLTEAEFLPKVGDAIALKVTFSPKDGPLSEWAQSIPRGLFSSTVKAAITAYLERDPTYALPRYPKPAALKERVVKTVAIGKADYQIYCYLFSKKPRTRSREIKAILRFFLRQQLAPGHAPTRPALPVPTVSAAPSVAPRPAQALPTSEADLKRLASQALRQMAERRR